MLWDCFLWSAEVHSNCSNVVASFMYPEGYRVGTYIQRSGKKISVCEVNTILITGKQGGQGCRLAVNLYLDIIAFHLELHQRISVFFGSYKRSS